MRYVNLYIELFWGYGLLMEAGQKVIKETFTLNEVPKEALYFGLAGVVPYLATSLNTCYLAWEINNNAIHGSGFLLSGDTASFLLHLTEPIQVGYGAVVSYDRNTNSVRSSNV